MVVFRFVMGEYDIFSKIKMSINKFVRLDFSSFKLDNFKKKEKHFLNWVVNQNNI